MKRILICVFKHLIRAIKPNIVKIALKRFQNGDQTNKKRHETFHELNWTIRCIEKLKKSPFSLPNLLVYELFKHVFIFLKIWLVFSIIGEECVLIYSNIFVMGFFVMQFLFGIKLRFKITCLIPDQVALHMADLSWLITKYF